MPAHVTCRTTTIRADGSAGCFVVCREHELNQGFGAAHEVALAACAEHNRLHHPDPRAKPNQLRSIVYDSRATAGFNGDAVGAMLERARRRNRAFGVTGMLLTQHGWFLQALEGPPVIVDDLMRTIERDPRHRSVRVLVSETCESRRFPDWAMASGHIGDVEARPLAEYYEGLLMARGAAEDDRDPAPGRGIGNDGAPRRGRTTRSAR